MSTCRIFALLALLSSPAVAEVSPFNPSALPALTATGSSMAASTGLPAPLSEEKRPFALALGITLVAITFHQAFARRQRA